jgi:hypothetical protein
MNPRFVCCTLAALALLGAGFAWRIARTANHAENTVRSLAPDLAQQQNELRSASARLQSARERRDALAAHLPTTTNETKLRSTPAPPPAPDPLHLLSSNPELHLLKLAARRAHLETVYGPLWQRLQLSPAEIEHFRDLFIARDEQQDDLLAAARAKAGTMNDPAVAQLRSEMENRHRTALRELLGEARFRDYQDYERMAPLRETVGAWIGGAAVAGLSFTREQAEQLTHTLAAASADYTKGGWGNAATVDWSAVRAQARTFLSEAQIEFVLTNEVRGRGAGGRFLPQFHHLVREAQQAERSPAAPRSQ